MAMDIEISVAPTPLSSFPPASRVAATSAAIIPLKPLMPTAALPKSSQSIPESMRAVTLNSNIAKPTLAMVDPTASSLFLPAIFVMDTSKAIIPVNAPRPTTALPSSSHSIPPIILAQTDNNSIAAEILRIVGPRCSMSLPASFVVATKAVTTSVKYAIPMAPLTSSSHSIPPIILTHATSRIIAAEILKMVEPRCSMSLPASFVAIISAVINPPNIDTPYVALLSSEESIPLNIFKHSVSINIAPATANTRVIKLSMLMVPIAPILPMRNIAPTRTPIRPAIIPAATATPFKSSNVAKRAIDATRIPIAIAKSFIAAALSFICTALPTSPITVVKVLTKPLTEFKRPATLSNGSISLSRTLIIL